MSIYSGKCDVADWFEDYDDEMIRKSNFYISGHIVPLRIDNHHDLSPYYPYLIAVGGRDSSGHSSILLSEESFVDSEEREMLGWKLCDIQKYYRKCKRKRINYNIDEATSQGCLFCSWDNIRRIAEIVGERGEKVTVEDLISEYKIRHPMSELYRKKLFERMIELGWSEKQARYWIWKDRSIGGNT